MPVKRSVSTKPKSLVAALFHARQRIDQSLVALGERRRLLFQAKRFVPFVQALFVDPVQLPDRLHPLEPPRLVLREAARSNDKVPSHMAQYGRWQIPQHGAPPGERPTRGQDTDRTTAIQAIRDARSPCILIQICVNLQSSDAESSPT
ncbi:MAG: hypothetical protein LJE91_04505 [Gammaproteobacteria bacterium]|nr:hypothetical protein [Gammaproteobacteria bacterium]